MESGIFGKFSYVYLFYCDPGGGRNKPLQLYC